MQIRQLPYAIHIASLMVFAVPFARNVASFARTADANCAPSAASSKVDQTIESLEKALLDASTALYHQDHPHSPPHSSENLTLTIQELFAQLNTHLESRCPDSRSTCCQLLSIKARFDFSRLGHQLDNIGNLLEVSFTRESPVKAFVWIFIQKIAIFAIEWACFKTMWAKVMGIWAGILARVCSALYLEHIFHQRFDSL